MTQATERKVYSGGMSLPEILIFPLKMLWIGNFLVLLYILLCVGCSIELAMFLQKTLIEFVHDLMPNSPYLHIAKSASYAFFLICIPCTAVAAGLPIRVIWTYNAFLLRPVVVETKKCIQRFVRILRVTYINLFYAILPLLGMFIIRKLTIGHNIPEKGLLLINICLGIAVLVALYNTLRWLFIVLLTTFVDINESFALQNAKAIMGHKIVLFIAVLVCGVGGCFALYFMNILRNSEYLPFLLGFILWYTFALLVVLTLEAGEAHAQMNGATLRVLAPSH